MQYRRLNQTIAEQNANEVAVAQAARANAIADLMLMSQGISLETSENEHVEEQQDD